MKKLLIWDGDETLWTGTIAENDQPVVPQTYVDLCHTLTERGVLQALASHNLPADALAVLDRYDLSECFLHNRIAFGVPKSQMVRSIIDAYGLSRPEDVVFVDDSPFNRAEVTLSVPGVTVRAPADVATLLPMFFTKDHYTEEDRLRVRRYRSMEQRQQASVSYGEDYQAFLKSCGFVLHIAQATTESVPRIVDLAARANRMAALAHPLTQDVILQSLPYTWVASGMDRFGDHGLIGFLIATPTTIKALVISCRLQGRGVGSALLGWWLRQRPLGHSIDAQWSETPYNAGMAGLFQWFGFQPSPGDDPPRRQWVVLTSASFPRSPDWIEIKS